MTFAVVGRLTVVFIDVDAVADVAKVFADDEEPVPGVAVVIAVSLIVVALADIPVTVAIVGFCPAVDVMFIGGPTTELKPEVKVTKSPSLLGVLVVRRVVALIAVVAVAAVTVAVAVNLVVAVGAVAVVAEVIVVWVFAILAPAVAVMVVRLLPEFVVVPVLPLLALVVVVAVIAVLLVDAVTADIAPVIVVADGGRVGEELVTGSVCSVGNGGRVPADPFPFRISMLVFPVSIRMAGFPFCRSTLFSFDSTAT